MQTIEEILKEMDKNPWLAVTMDVSTATPLGVLATMQFHVTVLAVRVREAYRGALKDDDLEMAQRLFLQGVDLETRDEILGILSDRKSALGFSAAGNNKEAFSTRKKGENIMSNQTISGDTGLDTPVTTQEKTGGYSDKQKAFFAERITAIEALTGVQVAPMDLDWSKKSGGLDRLSSYEQAVATFDFDKAQKGENGAKWASKTLVDYVKSRQFAVVMDRKRYRQKAAIGL